MKKDHGWLNSLVRNWDIIRLEVNAEVDNGVAEALQVLGFETEDVAQLITTTDTDTEDLIGVTTFGDIVEAIRRRSGGVVSVSLVRYRRGEEKRWSGELPK
jgi:hypothetical protein